MIRRSESASYLGFNKSNRKATDIELHILLLANFTITGALYQHASIACGRNVPLNSTQKAMLRVP